MTLADSNTTPGPVSEAKKIFLGQKLLFVKTGRVHAMIKSKVFWRNLYSNVHHLTFNTLEI